MYELIFVFAVCIIVFMAIFFIKRNTLEQCKKKCTEKTEAVVVATTMEIKNKKTENEMTYSYPTFKFYHNNQQYIVRYKYGTIINNYSERTVDGYILKKTTPQFEEGRKCMIKFDPNSPDRIYIPYDKDPYSELKGYLIISAVLFFFMIFFIICVVV